MLKILRLKSYPSHKNPVNTATGIPVSPVMIRQTVHRCGFIHFLKDVLSNNEYC